MRQGALDGLVIEAIARAAGLAPADVRAAAMYAPSLGELARAALEEGAAGLGRFSLRLLSPVAPMLASPAGDAEEALERLGEAAFEYKLDGARLQVHRAGDEVRVFTRQLQDVTARVPEVVEWARALPVREAVVEGEALALRARRAAAALPGDDAPARPEQGRRGRAPRAAALVLLLRPAVPRGRGPARRRCPTPSASSGCSGSSRPTALLPRLVTRDPEEAERFFDQALAAGPRGPDGEVARRRPTRPASAASTG